MIKFFEHLPYWVVIAVLLYLWFVKATTPIVNKIVEQVTHQTFSIDCQIKGFVLYSPNIHCDGKV